MIQIPPSEPEKLIKERPDQPMPPNSGMVPLLLFLASLTMLFAAMMVGYLMIRGQQAAPAFGAIKMPPALWGSTAILLIASVTMHMALNAVKSEKQTLFRQCLIGTFLLSLGFVLIQFPSLFKLLKFHYALLEEHKRAYYYGMVFFMIVVHALHVAGGMICLGVVTYKAHKGVYDHEFYGPVKYTEVYWHFLDVVWIVMFLTMYAVG